mgnify:CR=1 FL=1
MFYDWANHSNDNWEKHNKDDKQPGSCLISALVSVLTAILTTLAIRGWL